MKRFMLRLAIVAFAATNSFADGGILVGGGMSLSNLSVSKLGNGVTQKMNPGFKVDWNYWYMFNDKMGIIAGVDFETRGAKFTVDTTTTAMPLYYFQIPILFSYTILNTIVPRFLSDFSVSIGPEIGILARTDDAVDDLDYLNSLDYGASVNLGITVCNHFVVGGGYNMGFTKITKGPSASSKYADLIGSSTLKNSTIKIFIDYKYRVKS
jgi:hypothetical protein